MKECKSLMQDSGARTGAGRSGTRGLGEGAREGGALDLTCDIPHVTFPHVTFPHVTFPHVTFHIPTVVVFPILS